MPAQSIHAALFADHDLLEEKLDQLIGVFETGDWLNAREAFAAFERRLTSHFAFEEELLFPEFARTFPHEAQALAAEHQSIRKRVEELAIGIDIHQTRLSAIEELAALIRAHAIREDHLLYRWTDDAPWASSAAELFSHQRSPAPPEGP